jgi:hypothetical protein
MYNNAVANNNNPILPPRRGQLRVDPEKELLNNYMEKTSNTMNATGTSSVSTPNQSNSVNQQLLTMILYCYKSDSVKLPPEYTGTHVDSAIDENKAVVNMRRDSLTTDELEKLATELETDGTSLNRIAINEPIWGTRTIEGTNIKVIDKKDQPSNINVHTYAKAIRKIASELKKGNNTVDRYTSQNSFGPRSGLRGHENEYEHGRLEWLDIANLWLKNSRGSENLLIDDIGKDPDKPKHIESMRSYFINHPEEINKWPKETLKYYGIEI